MKKYYPVLDITKFILAIFVVFIHTDAFRSFSLLFNQLISQGYARLAVPMFFAISSFLLFKKSGNQHDNIKKYVLRMIKLYIFYFVIFAPITICIRAYHINTYGIWYTVLMFLKDILFSSSFKGAWYINASILGTLIVYGLSKKHTCLLWILGVIGFIFSVITSSYGNLCIELTETVKEVFAAPYNSFLVSIIYISLGKYLAEHKKEEWIGYKWKYFLAVLSLILLTIEIILTYQCHLVAATDAYFMLIPTTYFQVVILLQIHIRNKPVYSILRKMSIMIYMFHIEYTWLVVTLCEKILNIQVSVLVLFFIVLGLSLLTSFCLLYLYQKLNFKWLRNAM